MAGSADRSTLERAVTVGLALALVVAVAGVIYVAVNPPETTPPYTEFSVVGPEGMASGYPTNLSVGETGTVIVGIANHEHETVTYTAGVVVGGEVRSSQTVTVGAGESVERHFSFRFDEAGEKRVRILLYKGSQVRLGEEPYRWLRLFVNVTSG